jgi:hypothetical protein
MNNIERDKFLTEAIGICWHESNVEQAKYFQNLGCDKCNSGFIRGLDGKPDGMPNFSTWEGFGKLWEWANKQAWWCKFRGYVFVRPDLDRMITCSWINPDTFADKVYQHLKEQS